MFACLGLGCYDPPFSLPTLYAPVQDVLPAQWHPSGTKGSCGDFSTSPCTREGCCSAGCHRNTVDEMSMSYPSPRYWACWFVYQKKKKSGQNLPVCINFLALPRASSTQPIVLCGFPWGCSATGLTSVLSGVGWRQWGGQLGAGSSRGARHAACSS